MSIQYIYLHGMEFPHVFLGYELHPFWPIFHGEVTTLWAFWLPGSKEEMKVIR